MNRNVSSIILIVLAVAVYMTFTTKVWDETKSIQAVNKTYLDAIKNAEELIAVRDTVLEKYNSISPYDQDRLNKMLPVVVDNIRLIVDLNSVAIKRGLALRSIKATLPETPAPQPEPTMPNSTYNFKVPDLGTVEVSFIVVAQYDQFIQFIKDLETNLRIMDLNHLVIKTTPPPGTSNAAGYEYTVKLKTYRSQQQ